MKICVDANSNLPWSFFFWTSDSWKQIGITVRIPMKIKKGRLWYRKTWNRTGSQLCTIDTQFFRLPISLDVIRSPREIKSPALSLSREVFTFRRMRIKAAVTDIDIYRLVFSSHESASARNRYAENYVRNCCSACNMVGCSGRSRIFASLNFLPRRCAVTRVLASILGAAGTRTRRIAIGKELLRGGIAACHVVFLNFTPWRSTRATRPDTLDKCCARHGAIFFWVVKLRALLYTLQWQMVSNKETVRRACRQAPAVATRQIAIACFLSDGRTNEFAR